MNLLDQPIPDRYRLHDIVRDYAAHQVEDEEPPAARHLADRDVEAGVLCGLGNALELSGRHHAAIDRYQQALRLSPPVDHLADLHRLLGLAQFSLGHYDDALGHWHEALALYQDIGDARGEIATRNNMSCNHDRLGDHRSAVAECSRALAIARNFDHPQEEADTRHNLGLCQLRLGHRVTAERHLRAAIALYRRTGDRLGEAATLNNLGILHRQRRDTARALGQHHRTFTLSERIGNINLAAEILNDTAATRTADAYELARAHDGIARILLDRGRPSERPPTLATRP